MKPIIIAVDFDGTCVTHEFPKVGKDIGAVPVLKRLVAAGHKIILWTMRGNVSEGDAPVKLDGNYLDDAVNWFLKNDIPLYGIQSNPEQHTWTKSPKAYAQLYIDDAALGCPLKFDEFNGEKIGRHFVDWEAVENCLEVDGVLEPTNEFTELIRMDMAENNQKSHLEC